MIKNMVYIIFLLLIGGAADAAAQTAGSRSILSTAEKNYQSLTQNMWKRLRTAERIINGPMGAVSLVQMDTQAQAFIRQTTQMLHAITEELKRSSPPDLFVSYHRNFTGWVHSLSGLVAGFEPVGKSISKDLRGAFLKSRGDRIAFRRIAGALVTRTVSRWLPSCQKRARTVAFFQQRLHRDLKSIDSILAARIQPSEELSPPSLATDQGPIVVSPFFLPIVIKTFGQTTTVSNRQAIETPLGPVAVSTN